MQETKTIRVAHVIGRMVNGGVEAVVFNYYRNIDKEKYQFDFFYDTDSTVEPLQELIDMGARFYLIPAYKNVKEYSNRLIQLFRENEYQIVHSHMNTLNVFALRAAKKAGVPIRVAHNHSTAGKGETKKNILKYMLRPFATIYPTHLAACSHYAGEWLYGKKREFTVFNNAIDTKKFRYNEEIRLKLRKQLNIESKFVIGHIGRFCYQKNQEFLVDIFNEYIKINPNSILLLIGGGEELDKIKEKVNGLNLTEKVIFTGSVTNAYEYYQTMDIFVLPSRYEGLPVVGVEAQIVGLPCLFSDAMTKETKFTKQSEFINLSKSNDLWIQKIDEYKDITRIDNLELAKSSGFEIKTEAKKLEEYYKNLLNERV